MYYKHRELHNVLVNTALPVLNTLCNSFGQVFYWVQVGTNMRRSGPALSFSVYPCVRHIELHSMRSFQVYRCLGALQSKNLLVREFVQYVSPASVVFSALSEDMAVLEWVVRFPCAEEAAPVWYDGFTEIALPGTAIPVRVSYETGLSSSMSVTQAFALCQQEWDNAEIRSESVTGVSNQVRDIDLTDNVED